MAERHKSKYKKPENSKPTRRKDITDYTHDDKAGALNPYSTGKRQEKVARKTDKPIQDDGKMFPKYTEKDRLYKKIEDGDYDPKHAMNVLRKRQETDTDEYFDTREKIDHGVTTSELKERINQLSPKQREQLIREYLRRKIAKVLREQPEQPTDPEQETTEQPGGATPGGDAAGGATPGGATPAGAGGAAPGGAGGATPAPGGAAAPGGAGGATPGGTTPTPGGAGGAAPGGATPAPGGAGGAAPDDQNKEEQQSKALTQVVQTLTKEPGSQGKIDFIMKSFDAVYKDADVRDTRNFLKLLRRTINKKLIKLGSQSINRAQNLLNNR